MERNKEDEQVFGIINGTALNVSKCLLLNDLHTVYLHFFDRCYQPMPHTQCIVAIAMSLLPGTRKGSSSQSQLHQQSSHVAMTLFGHDPLVSQETHKRVIPKFVQQMCRQVLSSSSSSNCSGVNSARA
jgi:hypothetical protein